MKKRLISMLLTAGMLVSLVAGCGSKAETPGASGDSNGINKWGISGDQSSIFNRI